MDDKTRLELRDKLDKMQQASNVFYSLAVKISHHQFIEFAGFLNEYIKMCEGMVKKGIDFTDNELRAREYQLQYVAKKLDCIYGGTLANPSNMEAFLRALFEKIGWGMNTSPEALAKHLPTLPTTIADRLAMRPENYATLSPREQWDVDKELGLLDYEGGLA